MADVINYRDVVQMHVDKFGVEPVVTGTRFWQSGDLIGNILEAIEDDIPYTEPELPENTIIWWNVADIVQKIDILGRYSYKQRIYQEW